MVWNSTLFHLNVKNDEELYDSNTTKRPSVRICKNISAHKNRFDSRKVSKPPDARNLPNEYQTTTIGSECPYDRTLFSVLPFLEPKMEACNMTIVQGIVYVAAARLLKQGYRP